MRSRSLFAAALACLLLTACTPDSAPLAADPPRPPGKGDTDDEPLTSTQALADHADLQLFLDTPHQAISRVLLFGGTESIVPLQVQLIKALPAAEFFVVPSERQEITAQTYRDALSAAGVGEDNVQLYEGFRKGLTDWTQDRVMRWQQHDRVVLLPVMSGSLAMNERAGFELGVPRLLEERYPETFARLPQDRYYAEKVVDNATGEVYAYSSWYDSWYRGSVWRLAYGDGGDRVTTESTLFVRGPTHAKMISTLKKEVPVLDGDIASYEELLAALVKKQVVKIGEEQETKQYVFHLDMFLTAFDAPGGGDTTVILGSPLVGLQETFGTTSLTGLPSWIDDDTARFNQRLTAFKGIRADLLAAGFEVVEIPILFLDFTSGQQSKKRIVTFNNGLLTHRDGKPTFLSVGYAFGQADVDAALAKAQAAAKQRIEAAGLHVVFLPGGENSAHNGGELRCTAGVIGQGLPEPEEPPPPSDGPLLLDDFEAERGWQATGLWHRAARSACAAPGHASPDHAWYFGRDDACDYAEGGRVRGELTSPPIPDVGATSQLSFAHARAVEKTSAGSYDRTYVQVAAAGQDAWETVWSRDSRDASDGAWQTTEPVDLSAFAGQTIRVRFLFDSVDGYANKHAGWLIDDVRVTR